MTVNRQPEGIPIGGQFAAAQHAEPALSLSAALGKDPVGELLEQQFTAARARYEAWAQNDWASDVRRKYPDAIYAYVGVTNDRSGRYTAGMGLYTADGEIEVSEDDQVFFEDTFNVGWDMDAHRDEELNDGSGNSEMFSLESIRNHWEEVQSTPQEPADRFAHMTGRERAKAQSDYAAELKREATETYVKDLSAKLLAINPDFGRLYVKRNSTLEDGVTFNLDRVEDIHRNVGNVDLSEFEEYDLQGLQLDPYVDYDESTRDLYINLDPGD